MSTPEETPAVNRKLLILLGGVAAVTLLAAFVVLPLLTSDTAEDVDLVSPPTEEAPGAGTDADAGDASSPDVDGEEADEADEEADEVEETFEVFTARDPFKQLVVPTVAEETPDGEPQPQPDEGAGDGVDPDGEDPDGDDPPPAEKTVEAYVVEIIDVYRDGDEDKVQVTVNDTGYDVAVNERFADHFQLLSVDGDCATLLYGDNRFVLCTGDTIRK